MSRTWTIVLIASAGSVLASLAHAQSLDGSFRGSLVCSQLKSAFNMLRAPLDVIIHGSDAIFARPVFNANGSFVVGSELGPGTVTPDGKLHLTATWENGRNGFTSDYGGTLTASGGTLIGTEIWHVLGGLSETRTCTAALVPVHPGSQTDSPK
jgi:hypothetical protein